jgi:hypothetical protein
LKPNFGRTLIYPARSSKEQPTSRGADRPRNLEDWRQRLRAKTKTVSSSQNSHRVQLWRGGATRHVARSMDRALLGGSQRGRLCFIRECVGPREQRLVNNFAPTGSLNSSSHDDAFYQMLMLSVLLTRQFHRSRQTGALLPPSAASAGRQTGTRSPSSRKKENRCLAMTRGVPTASSA